MYQCCVIGIINYNLFSSIILANGMIAAVDSKFIAVV